MCNANRIKWIAAGGLGRLGLVLLLAAIPALQDVRAAVNPDTNIIPVGRAGIPAGTHDFSYRFPEGPRGAFARPLVFMGAQPYITVKQEAAPLNPDLPPPEERKQVPATIQFTVAGRKLPPWELQPKATAYVINFDTVRSNPKASSGALKITVDLQTQAEGLDVLILAMPDPLLLDDHTDGPLAQLAAAAKNPDVHAYFEALERDASGDKEAAREAYEKLRNSTNPFVGRLARRGLRTLAYDLRERKLFGNFNEHLHWALYLEQCGMFDGARRHYDECRVADPQDRECQFRGGEALERLGGTFFNVLDYMERAALGRRTEDVCEWYCLVVILKQRGPTTLTQAEIDHIKDQVYLMQGNIWGATRGRVRVYATFLELANDVDWPYVLHGGVAWGPPDAIVARRGWFDVVLSVAPRLADDPPHDVVTVGGDQGPNGAGLSAIPHDLLWIDYLRAMYDQLARAAAAGETGRGFPQLAGTLSSGNPLTPHRGAAARAALHYGFSDHMWLSNKVADLPQPGTHLTLWQLEGPFPASGPGSGAEPGRHVLDPIPETAPGGARAIVSDRDFIDLREFFPDTRSGLVRATTWVYSPRDQQVRMWIGQNDGVAIWLNGRCIHRGDVYAAHKYADRNLVDTVAGCADLKHGWNELRVVVEGWPAPHDKGWGFSIRLCDWKNGPIPGLAGVNVRPTEDLVPPAAPKAGVHYSWAQVQDDYTRSLPLLTPADLTAVTGIKGLTLAGSVGGPDGHVVISADESLPSPRVRRLDKPWQSGDDRDFELNNVMDWSRESCAAIRFQRDGNPHDLLFVKPEALLAYMTLLAEPQSAVATFGRLPPADRLLGYCLIPSAEGDRILFVIDCLLGDASGWPLDEEDLLNPIPRTFVPNKKRPARATAMPLPTADAPVAP